jgi:hypothetical protein
MSTIDDTCSGKTDISTIPTKTSIRDMTLEHTPEAIKNVANNIPESSFKMREAVKAIHQSGAIDELTEPVREATITTRDTAREISETAKDMRERGAIRETINAAEDVNMAARKTTQTVKDTVSTAPRKPPPPSPEKSR